MPDLYAIARPLLFRLDPEKAHSLTIGLMKRGAVPRYALKPDPALEQTLWNLRFPSPIGMAAGFDKNAEAISPLFHLGFGFVETGTVTPKPQDGNPKPRIFRCPEHEAVINRMGFPNKGMHAFKSNIERFLSSKPRVPGVLGINIGMNKGQTDPVKDYALLIRMLGPMADYLTVNISSPNTPGLRDLQKRETLLDLIGALREERRKACGAHPPPLLLKLAPDLSEEQQEELAQAALDSQVDGLVLTNTTLDRPGALPPAFSGETGGLSGQPLTNKSTGIIRNFYRLTDGKIPIVGAGGVSSGRDAYAKIKAGASLIQLYTALVFKGPSVARCIHNDLHAYLKADGFDHIGQAVGIDVKPKKAERELSTSSGS